MNHLMALDEFMTAINETPTSAITASHMEASPNNPIARKRNFVPNAIAIF